MESRGRKRKPGVFLLSLAALLVPSGESVLTIYPYSTPGQRPTATRFDDVPAMEGFGPRIPEQGFAGRLQLAKPDLYACSALSPAAAGAGPASPQQADAGGGGGEGGALTRRRDQGTSGEGYASAEGAGAGRGGWGGLSGGEVLGAADGFSPSPPTHEGGGGGSEDLPLAVLISRSNRNDPAPCTFEDKVLNAQAAGFSMVVVYDSQQENLFKMGSIAGRGHSAVEIPLVLVSHASGLALMTLISASSNPHGPEMYVDNTDPFGMFVTVNLTMFMLVTGFLLALLTCGSMMVVTLHRYLRRYESLVAGTHRPMPLPEVLQLPEVRVEAGSRLEGDSCPVCLEAYRIGDKLRNLPCEHAFHAGCITPWLTQRQRTCPMCKDPITQRPSPASSTTMPASSPVARETGASAVSGGGGVGGERSDRLPLLTNSRGGSDGGSIQEPSPV